MLAALGGPGVGSVGLIELEELFIEEEVVKLIARYCTSTVEIEVSSPMIDGHIRKQDGGERNGDEPMTADTFIGYAHSAL